MKYVKLFEEFEKTVILKYELIKELPIPIERKRICMPCEDNAQLDALVYYLEKQEIFENKNGGLSLKDGRKRSPEGDDIFIFWGRDLINTRVKYNWGISQNLNVNRGEILIFNDYFKLKHEYRGQKLKKFGV